MNAGTSTDWTAGAAKWFAVLVLGGASIAGMLWSMHSRVPASWAHEPAPQVVEIRPSSSQGPTTPAASPSSRPAETSGSKAYPREKMLPDGTPAVAPGTTSTATPGAGDSNPAVIPAKLDLNTATIAQLELLPGIGPAIAKRIVEYREQHGKFATLESLDAVKGIGPKTIARLRPLVTIE